MPKHYPIVVLGGGLGGLTRPECSPPAWQVASPRGLVECFISRERETA